MTGPSLPFTLRQLQYVLAIAGTKSFRKAALQCAVAQPSLSTQVAALEDSLGVRLFERDRRGVMVTSAGQALLERIRRILLEAQELEEDAKHFQDPLSGPMRLGIIPTMAPYLLPGIVSFLRQTYPDFAPHWFEERTSVLVAQLQQGRLDGAVLALEADLENLETLNLGRDHFVLAMPKSHRLAAGRRRIRLEELAGEKMLLLDDGHCLRDQALSVCREIHAHEMGFRATSLTTLVQMVANGTGLTLLPEMAADIESAHALLAIRRFADPMPFRTVTLAWRPGSHAAAALKMIAKRLIHMRNSRERRP